MSIYRRINIRKSTLITKRIFDIFFSVVGIVFLSPILVVCSIIIKLTSKGPVLYKQIRVGRNNKKFVIFKFRTMIVGADRSNQLITVGNDKRITSIGKFLRKYKIDELPQLFNVLFGSMSFVGPRPEVPKYVEMYNEEQKDILLLKPGITDYASIEFKDESNILGNSQSPEETYIHEIMPRKIELNLLYVKKISIFEDLKIILLTVFKIFT